ncbi:class I SAM-dependent methyltransferase [Verrucomicrobiaceae bacterium N1E253]|uniref:Class I SAM-dependent methyltransferase n=1 Tax=Oceaniferula marina TaxID=2748318 RepID=A0A851GDA7_9BACT|nr:class I SAM-dependent methyltransferase [Oceaniferula marina]NWK55396.1 class I SAM-dependent methyltransferase [Oceaniferula marina]
MYQNLEATLHDLFWSAHGADAELPIIKAFLNHYPGTVLELGCGSGRLMRPLRDDGYLVEGLDNAPEMLELCRQLPEGEDLILHQAGMEDFDTGSKYGAIIIPAFSLQLVPFEQIPAVFENILRHLQPDGGLYLSTFIPWAEITGEVDEGEWYLDQESPMPDGRIARCHTQFSIERLNQVLIREHRYEIANERGEVMESSDSQQNLTWLWPRELTMLLHHAGFSVEKIISDFDADADFDANGQILTLIATPREDQESDD